MVNGSERMSEFAMNVICNCEYPELIGMEPEGRFESDLDGARCYSWKCPKCSRCTLVRLNFIEVDE